MSINSRVTIYGFSSEEITFGNVTRKISPIKLNEDLSNFEECIRITLRKLKQIRAQHRKAKALKIKNNLTYINQRKKKRTFEEGQVILYKNVHISRGAGTSRILYKPGVIVETLLSGTHCCIQSLISGRILKYSYSYLKPFKDLSQLSRISLPREWQEKIRNVLSDNIGEEVGSDSVMEVTSGDEDDQLFGGVMGGSQESLITIQGDESSSDSEG